MMLHSLSLGKNMNELKKLKQFQKGSTLLEVLVSVFVLGFGLLALVTMQMKTVMTTREAENQTIVAQATDSLIESMIMNPNLTLTTLSGDDKLMYRDFDMYRTGMSTLGNCTDELAKLSSQASTGLDKSELAKAHLCTFVQRINQIPNTGKVYWNICMENAADAINKPVLEGATVKCNEGADATSTVLKVIWEQEIEDSSRYSGSGLTLNDAGTAVLYSYQAPISQ